MKKLAFAFCLFAVCGMLFADENLYPRVVVHTHADLAKIETVVCDAVKKVLPAVVTVRFSDHQGSGVVVSKDGYIFTVAHILGKPYKKVDIVFPDGKVVHGQTLGFCKWADAGLVKITDSGDFPFVELAPPDNNVTIGDWCFVLGHPLGRKRDRPPALRLGRVRYIQPHQFQSDCTIVSGDSGAPICDIYGRLIGISTRIETGVEANFHTSLNIFNDYYDRFKNGEVVDKISESKFDSEILNAFKESVANIAESVVRLKYDGSNRNLGTIIDSDGFIVTKRSELKEKNPNEGLQCVLADGRVFEAKLVNEDKVYDLALLKIDQSDLPAVDWDKVADSANGGLQVGRFVACVGAGGEVPLMFGVVSVPERRILLSHNFFGAELTVFDHADGLRVTRVGEFSPARSAGIRIGDIVTHINGIEYKNQEFSDLLKLPHHFKLGEQVKIKLKRTTEIRDVTIAASDHIHDASASQNRSGTDVSNVRSGFPKILQHDAPLYPNDCGGALVTLDGKFVGINIARGGRTETYVIPAAELKTVIEQLKNNQQEH